MKMYEILTLQDFYSSVQDKKMPIRTAYKFARLAHRAADEAQFYQTQFMKIVEEYAQKEKGQLVYSDDMTSIKIIPGKEDECAMRIKELKELEIDLTGFEFSIQELENLELTLAQMDAIFPLIKN